MKQQSEDNRSRPTVVESTGARLVLLTSVPGQSAAPQNCSMSSVMLAKVSFSAGVGFMMVEEITDPVIAAVDKEDTMNHAKMIHRTALV